MEFSCELKYSPDVTCACARLLQLLRGTVIIYGFVTLNLIKLLIDIHSGKIRQTADFPF